MRVWRLAAVFALTASAAMAASGGVASASVRVPGDGHHHHRYVCTGGVIPSGAYPSVEVAGICTVPAGTVTVDGDLRIDPGALLDAVTPGDPTTSPVVPATVDVLGNVWVGQGAVLLLGCSPNISCASPSPGNTFDQIGGNLRAIGAMAVVLHNVSIGGNALIVGGGGGTEASQCVAQKAGSPIDANLAPWSEDAALDFTPVYTDLEDGAIGGNLRVIGLDTCWLGTLRNWVGGNMVYAGNTFGDPDAMEIGNNLVFGNLGCWDNSPAPQFGDGAAPDLVNGHALGQCSYSVVLSNPSAEAIAAGGGTGVGVQEHFAVPMRSLSTSTGTRTVTNVGTIPSYPITTSTGASIFANLDDFTFTGGGLTGTADYTGGQPGSAPGSAQLGVAQPSGWSSYISYDACTSCTFDGQTGSVTLRTYGVGYPGGHTQGVFLITSSGTVLASASDPAPPLATLCGWGTFSGSGNTVTLVEHLGFG